MNEPITEEWLREVGFKWHQLERQLHKHWLLWLGDALDNRATSFDDLGVEVSTGSDDWWFCWLRSDHAGRYSRFIHIRHIRLRGELIGLIEGVTGRSWNPQDALYGSLHTPERGERLRAEANVLTYRCWTVDRNGARLKRTIHAAAPCRSIFKIRLSTGHPTEVLFSRANGERV